MLMGFEMETPDRNDHFEAPASAAFQALGACHDASLGGGDAMLSRLANPHKGLQKGVIDLVQNHLASSEHASGPSLTICAGSPSLRPCQGAF